MPLLSPKSLTSREVLDAGGKKLSRLRWPIIVARDSQNITVLYTLRLASGMRAKQHNHVSLLDQMKV